MKNTKSDKKKVEENEKTQEGERGEREEYTKVINITIFLVLTHTCLTPTFSPFISPSTHASKAWRMEISQHLLGNLSTHLR